MNTIYKYPIHLSDGIETEIVIKMHCLNQFLHLDVQDEIPTMWFMIDTHSYVKEYKFTVALTGFEAEPHETLDNYVGSFVLNNRFVGHIFRKP